MSDMTITITVNAAGLKKGVDEAQAKLKSVPDKKTTKLEADSKGLSGAISSVQKELAGMALGAMAAIGVWHQVGAAIRTSVEEARGATIAQRLLQSQLEATGNAAGLSAEELTKISKELQQMSNMGDDEIIKNLTVPLTTFRQISGDVFKRTQQAVLDLNAVLGDPNNPSSLRSVAVQVGKALNDPVQGLTALRRVGVSFSNSQIDTIKGLAETNRLAEAQGLILAELEKEFGGAAAATVNSSLQMKNAWNDMLESMGTRTLPALDGINLAFANFFTVMSQNWDAYADNTQETQMAMFRGWNDFSTGFVMNANALGKFIVHLGGIIAGSVDSVFAIGRSHMVAMLKSMKDVVDQFPTAALKAIGLDFSGFGDMWSDLSGNFKQTGSEISDTVNKLEYHFDQAISGFRDYEKEFGKITGRSAVSYRKQIELNDKLRASMDDMTSTLGGGGGGAGDKQVQAETNLRTKLLEILGNYHREAEQRNLSHYDKELIALNEKESAEEEMIREAARQKLITEDESEAMVTELRNIYTDKWLALDQQYYAEKDKADADAKAKEERDKQESFAKGISDTEAYYSALKFQDQSYYNWQKQQIINQVSLMDISEEKKVALIKQKMNELDAERAAWTSKTTSAGTGGINDSWFFGQMLGYDPDNPQDNAKIEAIKSTYSSITQGAQSMVSGLMNINNQRKQQELADLEETATAEKWSNERLLAEKKKINKKYEDEDRKLKRVQKALSISQAIVNTAEGVTAALKMGPILGPIMAAVISAMGAAQIAIISAQQFATGGLFRGKGGPKEDANIIAVSNGEYIVNAEATKRNKPLLDAINSNGLIKGFSEGGVASQSASQNGAQDEVISMTDKASGVLDPKMAPIYDVLIRIYSNIKASMIKLIAAQEEIISSMNNLLNAIIWRLKEMHKSINNIPGVGVNGFFRRLFGFSTGGYFDGTGNGTDDANIIAVSNGEYIVNAEATKRNKHLLDAINYGSSHGAALRPRIGYADGGMAISGGLSGSMLPRMMQTIEIIAKKLDMLDILNLNLVKKPMNTTVVNKIDGSTIIKQTDQDRIKLERAGYVPAV